MSKPTKSSAVASAFQILAYINALLGIIGLTAIFGNGKAQVLVYCIPAVFLCIAISSVLNFLNRIALSLESLQSYNAKKDSPK